jgi:hypothetical protein
VLLRDARNPLAGALQIRILSSGGVRTGAAGMPVLADTCGGASVAPPSHADAPAAAPAVPAAATDSSGSVGSKALGWLSGGLADAMKAGSAAVNDTVRGAREVMERGQTAIEQGGHFRLVAASMAGHTHTLLLRTVRLEVGLD